MLIISLFRLENGTSFCHGRYKRLSRMMLLGKLKYLSGLGTRISTVSNRNAKKIIADVWNDIMCCEKIQKKLKHFFKFITCYDPEMKHRLEWKTPKSFRSKKITDFRLRCVRSRPYRVYQMVNLSPVILIQKMLAL